MRRFITTLRNEEIDTFRSRESDKCRKSTDMSAESPVEANTSTIEAAMEEKGILIADKDTEFLKQVAEHFTSSGYEVEVTDSTVHVICNILKKHTPVVLLGSDFDKKIELTQLVKLLKKCIWQ
jgi:xanthine/CO dehydrogenase XdhC/CoxF family maturation factor